MIAVYGFSGELALGLNRFYCESIAPGRVELEGTEAHHAIHVMRIKPGEQVELFDGRGAIAVGSVVEVGRKAVAVEVGKVKQYSRAERAQVIIAASVAKGQRNDWMVSKCAELGVDHIAGVMFERTVRQAKGKSAEMRNHNLAVTAAKQCKRLVLPAFSGPADLEQTLAEVKAKYPQAVVVFGGWGEGSVPVFELIGDIYGIGRGDEDRVAGGQNQSGDTENAGKRRDVIAVVGPEGGFSDAETAILRDAGAVEVQLTETILRIETAAVAFASVFCTARDACV